MSTKKIAIVILTWNGLALTRRCLESLQLDTLPSHVEIIVVDNGSSDGTQKYVRGLHRVTLIENGRNLGYARAVNIGIRAAAPDADIVLLNNDVELIEPDWLDRLAAAANADERVGAVGVKILRDDGTLQHCGAYLPLDTMWGQQIAGGEVDIGQYSGSYECESIVFACVYIKRMTIDKVGLLSEDFFAYFEDTDYCLRVSLAGLKLVMCGDIRVKHSENSSTKINKVSHKDIFLKSQRTFRDKWGHYLANNRYKQALDWHSIINFPSGYAVSSRCLVEALDRSGISVRYKYVYGPGTVFPVVEPIHSDSYIVNMVRGREFGKAPVQVVYAQGDVFEKNTGKYKIGFTMLEVDGLPAEWVRQANLMDEVWVPSTFNEYTFRDSGVKVPIRVVPLGIDPAYFSPNIRGQRAGNEFTFLSVFEWGERKAPDILLRAFSDEFSAKEPVRLLCKVNNFDTGVSVRAEIAKFGLRHNGGRIVIVENQILKQYELGVLYRSADCFVLPTRGEGWGMPILEAMACGLPVIATQWGAQTYFMTPENSLPLKIDGLVPAIAKCPYYKGFRWAQPSYEHLRTLLRWVYEHQDQARVIGKCAAQDVAQRWTWMNAARRICALVEFESKEKSKTIQEASLSCLVPQYSASLSSGIDFTREGYPIFLTSVFGMSKKENWGRWIDANLAPTAKFVFNNPLPQKFTLELKAVAFGPTIGQPVKIVAGGVERIFTVKDASMNGEVFRLEFDGVEGNTIDIIPSKSIAPKDIGVNLDTRKLSIGLIYIKIV